MTTDVRVLGGSIAACVAALECARLGLSVELVAHDLDEPANRVTDSEGGWRWFTETFDGLNLTPVLGANETILNYRRQPVTVPRDSILGIPSSPLSEDVVAALGQRSATRAYLDRVKPVLTIGKEHRLDALVEKRMGKALRTILVEPLVFERFGVTSAAVDVAVAVSGLNEAITRTGSLSTAVLARLPEQAIHNQQYALTEAIDQPSSGPMHRLLRYWNVRVRFIDGEEEAPNDDEQGARATIIGDLTLADHHLHTLEAAGLSQLAVRERIECDLADRHDALLCTVRTSAREDWSLRIHESEQGETNRATLRSARRQEYVRPLASGTQQRSDGGERAAEVGALQSLLLEWRSSSTEYAPFVEISELHERNGILERLDADEQLRFVGDWLHGGDVSRAIVHARESATSLRRRLLGLS